ncbi:hypothetical protein QYF36_019223 [Acer negundo]|nr:hypothetical protein QYF36_019223 [Acer negundo]
MTSGRIHAWLYQPPQHFIHTAASHLVAVFVAVNAASRFIDVRRRRVTAAAASHFFVAATASHFFVAAAASHYLISSRGGDGWKNPDRKSFQYQNEV